MLCTSSNPSILSTILSLENEIVSIYGLALILVPIIGIMSKLLTPLGDQRKHFNLNEITQMQKGKIE
jgi:hypothetical protein